MGCAAQNIGLNVRTHLDDQLRLLDVLQKRNGTLQLLTFECDCNDQFNGDYYLQIKLKDNTFLTHVYKQHKQHNRYILQMMLINPPCFQTSLINELFDFQIQHYAPISLTQSKKYLIICHQQSSVFLQKIIKNIKLDLLSSKVILHAHQSDQFYYDKFQNCTKCVGEDELINSINTLIQNYDEIIVIGPMWLLRTVQLLSQHYEKPVRGLFGLCCLQTKLAKTQNQKIYVNWLELDDFKRECNYPDLDNLEQQYQLSEHHFNLLQKIIEAMNSVQIQDEQYIDDDNQKSYKPTSPRTNIASKPCSAVIQKQFTENTEESEELHISQHQYKQQDKKIDALGLIDDRRAKQKRTQKNEQFIENRRSKSTNRNRASSGKRQMMSSMINDDFYQDDFDIQKNKTPLEKYKSVNVLKEVINQHSIKDDKCHPNQNSLKNMIKKNSNIDINNVNDINNDNINNISSINDEVNDENINSPEVDINQLGQLSIKK